MIYFTSDQHFYHKRIIGYCQRPFVTADEMNSRIISNYNELVSPQDIVFFIGDFGFVHFWWEVEAILSKLYGDKILIKGNHDRLTNKKYKKAGFREVHSQYWYKGFLLIHNPADNYFNCPCICGHIHNAWVTQGKNINVSVDVHDFYPVPEKEIYRLIK